MIKTLHISSFIVVYVIYFTHIVHIDVVLCFSLLLKSYTFGCGKGIFSHSFRPTRLKHTSFCMEFSRAYNKVFPKNILYLFPEIISQNYKQLNENVKFEKNIYIFFYTLFFKKFENRETFLYVPSLC